MKRLLLFIMLAIACTTLYASSPRKMLMEEITNMTDDASGTTDASLYGLWERYRGYVCPVAYHSWLPDSSGDPIYLDNPELHRGRLNYYGETNAPIIILSGAKYYHPFDWTLTQQLMNEQISQTSPITITIEEQRNNMHVSFSVKVHSDTDISGKRLRVVASEYYHYFPHVGQNPDQHEKRYSARKMFPDHNGTLLNITAGGEETYDFEFDIDNNWQPEQMYITAFVQDDNSHEVLQAESNLKYIAPEISMEERYLKIAKNSKLSRTVELRNPYNFPIKINMGISQQSQNQLPASFELCEISSNVVELEPGETKYENYTFTRNDQPGCGMATCAIWYQVEYDGRPGVNKSFWMVAFALSEETKYLAYGGHYNNFEHFLYDQVWSSTNSEIHDYSALIDLSWDTELLHNYAPKDFDISFLAFDYWHYADFGVSESVANEVMEGLRAGKSVFLVTEYEIAAINCGIGASSAIALMQDSLDCYQSLNDGQQRVVVNQSGQLIGINKYTVVGTDGDPIGDGLRFKGNDYEYHQDPSAPYMLFTEFFSPGDESIGHIFCYYDEHDWNGAGIRAEIGDGRLVWLSFAPHTVSDDSGRNQLMNRITNWLRGANPNIAANTPQIYFGIVEFNKTKTESVEISNTTNDDVIINNISMIDNENNGYSIVDCPDLPYTLQADETLIITVEFAPTEEIIYEKAKLSVETDNYTLNIATRGGGLDPGSVNDGHGVLPSVMEIRIGPNPIMDKGMINIDIMKPGKLTLYLSDIMGRRVKDISCTECAGGNHSYMLDTGGIPSGCYILTAILDGQMLSLPLIVK